MGDWGIAEGLIFEHFKEKMFDIKELVKNKDEKLIFGLDFGYVNSQTAFIAASVNKKEKTIHIFDEFYEKGLLNDKIAQKIKEKGYAKEIIVADSAEPKSIDDLRRHGICNLRKSVKGKDSIVNGISYLQEYDIYIHPSCENTLMEFNSYRWEEKNGITTNVPVKENDHLIDALRYAIQIIKKQNVNTNNLRDKLGL